MKVHTCKNCCLIDQVINNQIQKYDTLSEENVSLHNALIKSRDTITQMGFEIANLRDGLIAERQRNLQMYIQQQTNIAQRGSHASVNVIVNPDPEEMNRSKLARKHHLEAVLSSTTKQKNDHVSLSQYNELMSLVDKQKQMYEADLNLFQSLSDKCITKLKEQLANMREHSSIMLEMYEMLRNDLFKEKKENLELRKLLQDAIDTMHQENAKQIEDIKKNILVEATKSANAHVKEAISMMKVQLEERDKLVARLRQQQLKMETYIEKGQQEFCKQQEEHKQVTDELKNQLKTAKQKYAMLDLRRSLDAQGFCNDIANIRKDLKQFKHNICSAGRKCEVLDNIQRLEKKADMVDEKIRSFYFKQQ